MPTLVRYFLQGCLVLVPTVLTGYIVYWLIHKVDGLLLTSVPGLGILLTLAAITVVGALASNVLGRALLKRLERLIERVPLVRLLYMTARDLVGAFIGEERSFDRPALVSMSAEDGLKALGFVTGDSLVELGLEDHVMVYFPQSYNFAGNTMAVPRARVRLLSVDAGRFMAMVVSGGVVRGETTSSTDRAAPAAE